MVINLKLIFVEKTRNWFRACDERGMRVEDRIMKWNEMYSFLVSKCNLHDYPPPKHTHRWYTNQNI